MKLTRYRKRYLQVKTRELSGPMRRNGKKRKAGIGLAAGVIHRFRIDGGSALPQSLLGMNPPTDRSSWRRLLPFGPATILQAT